MRFLILIPALILIACNGDDITGKSIYFGGEIINPNNNMVYLFKNDQVLDSAYLGQTRRFSMRFDNLNDGLYYFKHEPEMQYVFLEKGDSVLIRLNTLEFDESLTFSGKGSAKNNFLIDIFLITEAEEEIVKDLYGLDESEFLAQIDSITRIKKKKFKKLTERVELSDGAREAAEAGIDYVNWQYREVYPHKHRKITKETDFHELSPDFYAHRNHIDYNLHDLSYFQPYYGYIKTYINNIAYSGCREKCPKGSVAEIEKSLHYHKHKLHLIDSLIEDPFMRKMHFKNTARRYFYQDQDPENNKRFMETFETVNKDTELETEINDFVEVLLRLQSGRKMPSLQVIGWDGEYVNLETLTQGPQKKVFYFWWPAQKKHAEGVKDRLEILQSEHPSVRFIGISLEANHNQWKGALQRFRIDSVAQYHGTDYRQLVETLLINKLNKAIIINHEGLIVNAFSDVQDPQLGKELRGEGL